MFLLKISKILTWFSVKFYFTVYISDIFIDSLLESVKNTAPGPWSCLSAHFEGSTQVVVRQLLGTGTISQHLESQATCPAGVSRSLPPRTDSSVY